MKNFAILSVLLILPHLLLSQQLYSLHLEENQKVENTLVAQERELNIPYAKATVVIRGLNDLNNMNNYINVFGTTFIVERMDTDFEGFKQVVLRRKDGRDIFNLFQTVKARLVPVGQGQNLDFENSEIE